MSHSHSHSTPTPTPTPTTATAAAHASALNGAVAAPLRRGPRQALLSYAAQYRTLQPFLRQRLRNRRWRLVFSSDVHGTHLVDHCQRAFHEEEALWRAAVMERPHHGEGGRIVKKGVSSQEEAAVDDDGSSSSSSSSAAPFAFALVPNLALMETTLVVPAPVKNGTAAPSAPVHDVVGSSVRGEAPTGEEEHGKSKFSDVVDSHVCIGVYLQRLPAPESVTSYRRSEVFFFLFESPIQLSPTAEAARMDPAGQPAYSTPPAVSAPPPSVTQTSRRRRHDVSLSGEMLCDVGEESGDMRSPSTRSASQESLASSSPTKLEHTPRTQTHRLAHSPGESNTDGSAPVGSTRANDAAVNPEEHGGAFDSSVPPPPVAATRVMRDRWYDVNNTEGIARASDHYRSGTAGEGRRPSAVADDHEEQPEPVVPAVANGILSPQWQRQVEGIEQQQSGPAVISGGERAGMAPDVPPSPTRRGTTHNGGEQDDTFSSASASPDNGELDSTARPGRSATRRPPSLFNDSLSNSNGDGQRAAPFPAGATASSVYDHQLPAWVIEAVNSIHDPATPVTPCGVLEPPAVNDRPTPAIAPPSLSRAPNTQFTSPFEQHTAPAVEAGHSVLLEDDIVSESTTVVSATSATGGATAWREDENLSSYWPETPRTSNKVQNGSTALSSHTRIGHRSQEWYAPASDLPSLPPLMSRVSSLGGEDTADCFTPRQPRDGAPGRAGAAPSVDGVERLSAGLVGGRESPPLSLLRSRSGGGVGGGGAAPANSSLNSVAAAPAAVAAAIPVTMAAVEYSSAAPSVRPVSAGVEVYPMTSASEMLCDGAAVTSPADSNQDLDVPYRRASELAMTEDTIDVYSTSSGAFYIWDRRKDSTSNASPAAVAADGAGAHNGGPFPDCIGSSGGSGEHGFVCQRDATGVRWNVSYFVEKAYGNAQASGLLSDSSASSTGRPSSLLSLVRAQARRGGGAGGAAGTTTEDRSAEIFTSPLVKMQLCLISSRSMPSAFQRRSSAAAAAASSSSVQ
ncbi:hypothetical protein ABB37_01954 [Leptomonas pyrrhocoris]|uniref:Uncharacterized protein n=1 Tax=Leptomonas pyrrhocoris TaxID=157538 RepID=A0A0M9G6R0_LEPPY|nr:hypothetical protein ABB37_01954 [Leptomonas pyrrhocoris]KPA83700.1 hypothetical protein ABB37_01954 [Leptomonas pyrrhocoris]|eukprot:XP_015662139.1 hypothetical protein ABB37_01954 [Leptomonas pyrrhocoris]